MTDEQLKAKAREIAARARAASAQRCPRPAPEFDAAYLGLLEGRRMMKEEAAKIVHSNGHEGLATEIRSIP